MQKTEKDVDFLIEPGVLKSIHPWCLLREQYILTNGEFFMTAKEIDEKVQIFLAIDKENNKETNSSVENAYFYNLATNNEGLQSVMRTKVYERVY